MDQIDQIKSIINYAKTIKIKNTDQKQRINENLDLIFKNIPREKLTYRVTTLTFIVIMNE